MAFKIDAVEQEVIEFEIPAAKGSGTVIVSLPPLDCLSNRDYERLDKAVEELNNDDSIPTRLKPKFNAMAAIQTALKTFNTGKAKYDAIDGLVDRQLKAIDSHWAEESKVSMGESEPSTEKSSETNE